MYHGGPCSLLRTKRIGCASLIGAHLPLPCAAGGAAVVATVVGGIVVLTGSIVLVVARIEVVVPRSSIDVVGPASSEVGDFLSSPSASTAIAVITTRPATTADAISSRRRRRSSESAGGADCIYSLCRSAAAAGSQRPTCRQYCS